MGIERSGHGSFLRLKIIGFVGAALLLLGVATSASPVEDHPISETDQSVPNLALDNEPHINACDPDAAQFAVGQVATPKLIETIKQRSKAQFIRVLPKGAGATRDYITARINVHLDGENRIVAIRCG
jgi:hypothetical protein